MTETQLTEYEVSEGQALKDLNQVSISRREVELVGRGFVYVVVRVGVIVCECLCGRFCGRADVQQFHMVGKCVYPATLSEQLCLFLFRDLTLAIHPIKNRNHVLKCNA